MQSRYYCPECQRQFCKPESALQAFNGTHCPACGGQYLTLVTFNPLVPGDDYDPDAPDAPRVPVPAAPTPPNVTLLLSEAES
ncbi:hypothetical protein [Luteitalea sp.]|uniref:hypothetical protein n=1 Tax=Luteitalea sp. TaxID=2004800 RepID=UPI0025C322CD|nr:hypothetical protein [Luteitalea sp.]